MQEYLQWHLWELKRLKRLWIKPEQSALDLCHIVGIFWLWRHGARREFKVYPWSNRKEWYAIDVAMPHLFKGIEADGAAHRHSSTRDIVREHRLNEVGWTLLRVTTDEMNDDPKAVRRRVRKFLRS